MLRYTIRRLGETLVVLLVVYTLTFFLVRLAPGSPFDSERATTPEARKNLEAFYGRDQPLLQQYFTYAQKLILHGDFGPSIRYANRSVTEIIREALPVSFELGCYALAVALLLGLAAGMLASLRPNSLMDYAPMSLAMSGICLPTFVLGPLLILLFALKLDWVNPSGWFMPGDRILPALTLGGYYAAYVARLMRSGMLEIMNQDFIRTARAKGATKSRVIFKHAFRGGILPVVSFLGPAVAGLLTGSFVVETIFQIPGLGRYFVTAATNRDDAILLGTVLLFAVLIITLNFIVDVLLVWLNPKLRLE